MTSRRVRRFATPMLLLVGALACTSATVPTADPKAAQTPAVRPTSKPAPMPPAPRTISSTDLLRLVQGCCSGAGGTFSPAGQDCVISPDLADAFTGCVGSIDVRFDAPGQSGTVRHVTGEDFARIF